MKDVRLTDLKFLASIWPFLPDLGKKITFVLLQAKDV